MAVQWACTKCIVVNITAEKTFYAAPNLHCAMRIPFVRYTLYKVYPFSRISLVSEYGNLQTSMALSLSYFSVLSQCTVRHDLWRITRLVNKGGVELKDKYTLKCVQTERKKRENHLL